MEQLRRLTQPDIDFLWTDEQENALKEVKRLVTAATILPNFDHKLYRCVYGILQLRWDSFYARHMSVYSAYAGRIKGYTEGGVDGMCTDFVYLGHEIRTMVGQWWTMVLGFSCGEICSQDF